MGDELATTDIGVATTVVRPKSIEINEVNNGFTVVLRGGIDEPRINRNLSIANNIEEALEIAKSHLV